MEPVESVHYEVTDLDGCWMDVSWDLLVFNDISYPPMGIRCTPKFPDKGETGGFFLIQNPVVYPLVNIQKAIENGHRHSGFSH